MYVYIDYHSYYEDNELVWLLYHGLSAIMSQATMGTPVKQALGTTEVELAFYEWPLCAGSWRLVGNLFGSFYLETANQNSLSSISSIYVIFQLGCPSVMYLSKDIMCGFGYPTRSTTDWSKKWGMSRDSASQLVPKHRLGLFCDGFVYMGVSRNGGTLKSSILNLFNRIFPHKSSILGYPHLWKSPYVDNKINFIHLSVKSAGTPFCFATLNLSMGIPGS